VSVIPTHRPIKRIDQADRIYKTRTEKHKAIMDEVERLHGLGWPILIGTVNVDVSETLSRQLKRRGLKHEVLNAKYHQREAEIVAGAGQKSAITIATNMAPSATSRGGSTASCGDVPGVRAIRDSRSSSSLSKTT
jgi:preprotein translocase subunit SecA